MTKNILSQEHAEALLGFMKDNITGSIVIDSESMEIAYLPISVSSFSELEGMDEEDYNLAVKEDKVFKMYYIDTETGETLSFIDCFETYKDLIIFTIQISEELKEERHNEIVGVIEGVLPYTVTETGALMITEDLMEDLLRELGYSEIDDEDGCIDSSMVCEFAINNLGFINLGETGNGFVFLLNEEDMSEDILETIKEIA